MTPTQARAFLAVALTRSFSAAARSLGVSQPTVTNQVKQIENRYKVELFMRTRRGALLTPVGEALLPLMQRMFGTFDEARSYLEDVRGAHRGHLRIGSYGPYDVMKVVARYKQRFPRVTLSLDFWNSQSLTEKLLNYELDVAVLGRVERRTEFHTVPFRSPPLVVIAPRVEPWIRKRLISIHELKDETIVRREPGSSARAAQDRLLDKLKIPEHRIVQCGSREGVVGAVAAGVGIATIFDEGILPEDRVVKLKISGPAITSRVDVVCLAGRRSNRLVSSFLEVTREITGTSS